MSNKGFDTFVVALQVKVWAFALEQDGGLENHWQLKNRMSFRSLKREVCVPGMYSLGLESIKPFHWK